MFKIDKSSVEYLDTNKSFIFVKSTDLTPKKSVTTTDRHAEPDAESSSACAAEKVTPDENPAVILDAARHEADCIIADAILRSEQIKSDAWQKGYSEGMAAANEQMLNNKIEYEKMLKLLISQMVTYQEKADFEFEQNVLRLSCDIAKKIINIQLEKNDIVFEQLLKRTIQLHQTRERFVIRLHPSEYARFFSEGPEWLREELQCVPFTVISDPSMAEGGCTLESPDGIFRAGVDTQLEKLRAALGVNGSNDE